MGQGALAVVAEPTRREILRLVWDAEKPAGEIASHFDVTHAAVSQHLRVLREAGLVSDRREGRHRYYRAQRDALGPLAPMLEAFWTEALHRLKTIVEVEERDARRNHRR